MLGSVTEADDAVQETWLRLSRTDTSDVENLRAWLTTVVGRVCLNMLRARRTRREASLDDARAGSHRRARSRAATPSRRPSSATPVRARAARGPRLADARRAGRVRAPRRVRGAVRRHRDDRGPHADRDAPAREPRPAPRPGRARCRMSTSPASGRSSTPSSRRPAAATSSGCSRSWTRTWCCARMPARAVPNLTAMVRGAAAVAGQALTFRQFAATATRVLVNGVPGRRRLGTGWASGRGPGDDGQGRADRGDRGARGPGSAEPAGSHRGRRLSGHVRRSWRVIGL